MAEIEAELISSVEEVDRNQWDNAAKQSRIKSKRQYSQFIRAWEDGAPGEAIHAVVKKKGNIIGFMAGRLRNLPLNKKFLITSTPVVTSNEEEALRKMLEIIELYCKKEKVVYHTILSHNSANTRYNEYLKERDYSSSIHSSRHILNLDQSIESLKSGMSNSRRKKFQELYEKQSIDFFQPSNEDLIDFYEHSEVFLDRPEVSERGVNYFLKLKDVEGIQMASFTDEEGAVAQNLYLLDHDNSTANYLLSSVRKDYREHNALEILHSHAIRKFKENFSSYNFGTNRADFRDGVFNFKNQYGAEVIPQLMWKKNFSSLGNTLYLKILDMVEDYE